MDLSARISAHFEASAQLKLALAELLAGPIAQSAQMIVDAILNEKKVLSCGNGAGAGAGAAAGAAGLAGAAACEGAAGVAGAEGLTASRCVTLPDC